MHYHKLVRDKIPEIIKSRGDVPFTHIADADEYQTALMRKLQEEVDEFLANPCPEEIADILEVLRAICVLKKIDFNSVESLRQSKAAERGGFEQGIILDKIEKS